MKPGSTRNPGIFMVFAMLGIATLALISWDRKHDQDKDYKQIHRSTDTVPEKKDRKIRDLDEAIGELEKVNIDLELERAMQEVDKAMKNLDLQQAELDIQLALKEVNFEKIKAEVDKAMKEIDFKKIEQEVKESIAKIDFEKMQLELEKVKDIDMKEVQVEMEKAKEEMKKIRPQLEKELKNARVEIEKAKTEMKEYKAFVDDLDKDGLINKKESYSITHKDGKLKINDKEASAETYQKHRSFLEKHKNFNIEKDEDDFNIYID